MSGIDDCWNYDVPRILTSTPRNTGFPAVLSNKCHIRIADPSESNLENIFFPRLDADLQLNDLHFLSGRLRPHVALLNKYFKVPGWAEFLMCSWWRQGTSATSPSPTHTHTLGSQPSPGCELFNIFAILEYTSSEAILSILTTGPDEIIIVKFKECLKCKGFKSRSYKPKIISIKSQTLRALELD